MSDAFYKAFEDKYRGSRAYIKAQLQVYQPYVDTLRVTCPDGAAVDLACSKGEWLEILNEAGFDTLGFDTDRSLVELCKQRGLNVRQIDPLDGLKVLKDQSQILVSGFHLAEHIAFDHLKAIIKEAFRVLKPGGILILETPNPENMFVGSNGFYFDPRHIKPIPPLLLAFVPEYYGFSKIKILRMHEQAKSSNQPNLSLYEVLSGVSSTYAVVAQRSMTESLTGMDIEAIAPLPGVKLDALTNFYDHHLDQQFAELKVIATEALQLAKDSENKLNYIHRSLSWRLTKPLRWLDHQIKLLKVHGPSGRVQAFGRRAITSIVNRGFNYSATRPKVYRIGTAVIKKSGLYDRLCTYLVKAPIEIVILPPTIEEEIEANRINLRLDYMDSNAKAMYFELKNAIQNKEGSE